jgi:hypothetical protein
MCNAAGPMDHVSLDDVVQIWLIIFLRELSGYKTIDMLECRKAGIGMQENNKMDVGETTFLILNIVDISKCFSKSFTFHDVVQQGCHLEVKDVGHNIGSITCTLPWKQGLGDFRPSRICSKHNEKV